MTGAAGVGLLARLAEALARVCARWVPDTFSIAALLTLIAFGLGLGPGGATPAECLRAWGGGIWALLAFSMQMVVVIFAGYVLAVSPPARRVLDRLARLPRTPVQATVGVALLSMLVCWVNWGVGLIVGAIAVRRMARVQPDVDYRLLVASAYLGMGSTWHAGLSGSAPLLMATPDSFLIRDGLVAGRIGLFETVLALPNLGLMLVLVASLACLAGRLHPPPGLVRSPPPDAPADELDAELIPPATPTPAQRLGHAPWLNRLVGGAGLAYLLLEAPRLGATLDTVNLAFLSLAILLHPSPASLLRASEAAAGPLHGVVLQFPLYAGIYGIVRDTDLTAALAGAVSGSTSGELFPLVLFALSAALNYFVPSGGGQWAIQAPWALAAGAELGVSPAAVTMAYAYGDMCTNLIQPFWAIPLLGVARLEFRDILGFTIPFFLADAAIVSAFLLLF